MECTSCKWLRNVYILWCFTLNKTKNVNKHSRVRSRDWKSSSTIHRQVTLNKHSCCLNRCWPCWSCSGIPSWRIKFRTVRCNPSVRATNKLLSNLTQTRGIMAFSDPHSLTWTIHVRVECEFEASRLCSAQTSTYFLLMLELSFKTFQ